MTTSGTTSNNGSEEGRHHRHATIDSIIIGQGRNRAWSMEGARGGAAVNEFTPLIVPSFSFPKNNQQQQLLLLPHQPPSSSSQIIDNTTIVDTTTVITAPITLNNAKAKKNQTKKGDINSIMCLPCLYCFTAVIFAHEVFQPHINALSKLVILASVVHQFAFTLFSTLPFAIGQVQDAGLIFLSAMSTKIATQMISDAGGMDNIDNGLVIEIVSTTVVLLGLSTTCLGAVLILAGKFRFADAVAYLPLPVVGGYLAFIGYFCFEAGIALCVGATIMKPSDWLVLFNAHHLLLAFPGILAGICLTIVARKCDNEAMLPLSMVIIPTSFYVILYFSGMSISDAREEGWVGQTLPPVPVQDMFHLVHFNLVRWSLIPQIVPTWAGMVFVVSFSSCLDVAAISMDMGEALDTNSELITIGISNFICGLFGGFAGSYIFSQTIFTYRTGCLSRWIGILVNLSFIFVIFSTVNFIEVMPLFFLGSTLVFIGIDLMYEWIVDVRHKLLMSEYVVLLATFIAIQLVGIDGGIGLGIAVAIFDFVRTTAIVSNVNRVSRRSSALFSPRERSYIENHIYSIQFPKIITLECRGSVFFGSSMQFLSSVLEEIGVQVSIEEKTEITMVNDPSSSSRINSVRIPPSLSPASIAIGTPSGTPRIRRLKDLRKERANGDQPDIKSNRITLCAPPRFLVLDLALVANVDASAARGCFLQLARICARRNISVCATGCNSHIDWILQTHGAAHHVDVDGLASGSATSNEKIILFNDLHEGLQFCEKTLLLEAPSDTLSFGLAAMPDDSGISLLIAFTHFLGLEEHDAAALMDYEKRGKAFHSEILYNVGDTVFTSGTEADGFFVVLSGSVVILMDDSQTQRRPSVRSGAGLKQIKRRNVLESGQISRVLSPGTIFGFVDYVLKKPRTFSAVAWKDSLVAKCHRSGLEALKKEPNLERIVDKVLLLCSVTELAATPERL